MSSQLLTWLTWSSYVLVAPALAAAVSGVYFVASPRAEPLRNRILASAHGATIALLYVLAWIVLISGQSNLRLGTPFSFLLLLPLFLIIVSFFFYRGRKVVHWLQIINVVCLLWTGFTGIMLVTGESF
jgi:hypothetical protein